MLQIVQHQKSGEILAEEVPSPECFPNGILVRTDYSVISAGTERTSVQNAKSSLIQRAKSQPDQVKQVFDFVKKEGLNSTISRVKSKLDSFKMLGYSASGIVVESDCAEFSPGDKVACAGAGLANHAEFISIPKNLAAKIPDGVETRDAAYTTIGVIAMQGVRQSGAVLGDTVCVIGLGLIGQMTAMLLKAAGCRVIGLDINESLFEIAKKNGCDIVLPSKSGSAGQILDFTRSIGCDRVIITAGTSSNKPVELSMQIVRKKGTIVVVGAVGMNIPRNPFYEKEVNFKISCSYGPGRYDPDYELKGIDYPSGYVRWTENRNMVSFLDLINEKKINIAGLTTHKFELKEAKKAYELLTGENGEFFLGILLEYPKTDKKPDKIVKTGAISHGTSYVRVGFIGAGNFARNHLLPTIKSENCRLISVSTAQPAETKDVARQFGFEKAASDSGEIISDENINTIFCASWHNTHAQFVAESLKSCKNVYVEKPLAINEEELEEIIKAYKESDGKLMVGFNRRFSAPFRKARALMDSSRTFSMTYRVNSGRIKDGHWIIDKEQGGRIIGEVCHFIDCMVFMCGALPVRIFAEKMNPDKSNAAQDIVVITIRFGDGSIGSIQYFSNGAKSLEKEYFEIFSSGETIIIRDFKQMEHYIGSKVKKYKFNGKKGHREEVIAFISALREEDDMPISFDDLVANTRATFAVNKAISTGMPVEL